MWLNQCIFVLSCFVCLFVCPPVCTQLTVWIHVAEAIWLCCSSLHVSVCAYTCASAASDLRGCCSSDARWLCILQIRYVMHSNAQTEQRNLPCASCVDAAQTMQDGWELFRSVLCFTPRRQNAQDNYIFRVLAAWMCLRRCTTVEVHMQCLLDVHGPYVNDKSDFACRV